MLYGIASVQECIMELNLIPDYYRILKGRAERSGTSI